MPSKSAEFRKGVIALLIASALWGLTFPLVGALNEAARAARVQRTGGEAAAVGVIHDLHAAGFYLALRFSLAFLFLAAASWRSIRKMSLADWLKGGATGVAFTVGGLLQTVGLAYIPSSRSAFLTSLYVVFTPAFAILLGWEKMKRGLLFAAATALLGTAVISGMLDFAWGASSAAPVAAKRGPNVEERFQEAASHGDHATAEVVLGGNLSQQSNTATPPFPGAGELFTILSAAAFAVQILLVDHYAKGMQAEKITLGMFLATAVASALVLIPLPFAGRGFHMPLWTSYLGSKAYWLITLFICLVCTLGPFQLMSRYQASVGPTQASVIYSLEPIFAAGSAMVLPNMLSYVLGGSYSQEQITTSLLIGGALLLAANWIAASTPHAANEPS